MPTILAETFITALARLSKGERKQARLTAFELQSDPDHRDCSLIVSARK